MLTGEIRGQIDAIWNTFWSGGISNPLEVIEQITYLLFIRRLDELQTNEENKAARLGTVSTAAFFRRVRMTIPGLPAVQNDPLLSSLRGEDRYRELVGELRTSQQHYRQLYDDLRGAISSG